MLKMLFAIKYKLMFCIFMSLVSFECKPVQCDTTTSWLAGGWGIRILLPAGDDEEVVSFSIENLTKELIGLKTAKWVMLNLSDGSYGGRFTSYNKYLDDYVNPKMVPKRDLLKEAITMLKEDGYRIIVYYASDGPYGNVIFSKDGRKRSPKELNKKKEIREKWDRFLVKGNKSNDDVIYNILKQFSMKYGNNIDGWWFDHGKYGNQEMFSKAARSGNENTYIAWNEKHRTLKVKDNKNNKIHKIWGLARSNKYENYTNGHITSTRVLEPWSKYNDHIIEQIEQGQNGGQSLIDGIQAHLFTPIQSTWKGGEPEFPTDKAVNWTDRVTKACGAITWAVALDGHRYKKSNLSTQQYDQLKNIDKNLIDQGYMERVSE
jgi:hypothetical protein